MARRDAAAPRRLGDRLHGEGVLPAGLSRAWSSPAAPPPGRETGLAASRVLAVHALQAMRGGIRMGPSPWRPFQAGGSLTGLQRAGYALTRVI
ncbi:MAG: hypothetical protein AB1758_00520 [Candidatus Eremiobacterota bacterium]